jgi:hypothetical protein
MKNEILAILCSRERPQEAEKTLTSLFKTKKGKVDVILMVENDRFLKEYQNLKRNNVRIVVNNRKENDYGEVCSATTK